MEHRQDVHKVDVTTQRYTDGNHPVYRVTLSNGTVVIAETMWGIRKAIRMDRKAQKFNQERGIS